MEHQFPDVLGLTLPAARAQLEALVLDFVVTESRPPGKSAANTLQGTFGPDSLPRGKAGLPDQDEERLRVIRVLHDPVLDCVELTVCAV